MNRLPTCVLALLLMVLALPAVSALAQTPCADSLTTATNAYSRGFFDQAIHSLNPCWRQGKDLGKAQHVEVMRIMAISYIYKDVPDSTHIIMRHLMRKVDKNYQSNPLQDPLLIQELTHQYRIKWFEKRWVQMAGVAVAGGTTAFLMTRPEGPQQLAKPPSDPGPPN